MKKSEMISIVDPKEFGRLLIACKLPAGMKAQLVQERWDYLYQQYRPDEKHLAGLRDYGRRRA